LILKVLHLQFSLLLIPARLKARFFYCFTLQLPNIDLGDTAELDKLMPWSGELPALCRGGKPGNQA
jgi:hypothetical protein